MKRFLISIYKESLLLLRDIEGIILLFFMPMMLVIVVALLQHKTFQNLSEKKIPIAVIDFDNDAIGESFREGITQTGIFEVTEWVSPDTTVLNQTKEQVAKGKYQIGIIIPSNATKVIKNRALDLVKKQLPNAISSSQLDELKKATIQIMFDPVTKESFRSMVRSTFLEFASRTETRVVFKAYSKVIDAMTNQRSDIKFPDQSIIDFKEDMVSEYTHGIIPNAVQHNVPAWTLFGMFLICIPVAGSIITERKEGCMARLKTMPVSYMNMMSGKASVFVAICMLQALFIMLLGVYVMPHMGLPQLQIGNVPSLIVISLASSLAATGYGIAIGTIATTQVQASTFGSVSSVILAAIGGVWVPTMVMGSAMRVISSFSPLNWGVQGYYDVFLRHATVIDILPQASKLFLFFAICMILSAVFRRYQDKK